jgi:SAM-dependent methyltransferase
MSAAGWNAEGQDISEAAAEHLEREGFRIHRETVERLTLEGASFDVVIMSEVIEHLPTPDLTLHAVHRLLRPGGALYLTTPNFGSLSRRILLDRWRAIDLPGHLSYFDRRSLKASLVRAGFSRVRIWSEGLNPYELLCAMRWTHIGDSERLSSKTERLRVASARPGAVRIVKHTVNVGLTLAGLGDTLKAIAQA